MEGVAVRKVILVGFTLVDNKMKMVAGCHYEEWRFGPLGVECDA